MNKTKLYIGYEEFNNTITSICRSLKNYKSVNPGFAFESVITFSRGGLPAATHIANAMDIPKTSFHVIGNFHVQPIDKDEFTRLVRKKSTIIVDDILDTCRTMEGFFNHLDLPIRDSACKFIFTAIKEPKYNEEERLLEFRRFISDRIIGLDHTMNLKYSQWAVFPWEDQE